MSQVLPTAVQGGALGQTYGPGDPWPTHPKSYFSNALGAARAAGWSLQLLTGHSWGRANCPHPDKQLRCSFLIFSTGRNGEAAAKELHKAVMNCPHGQPNPTEEARRHLDAAERLYRAADELQLTERRIHRALELLDLAQAAADEMEALLNEAIELEDDARVVAGEALDELAASGLEVPDASPRRLVVLADERAAAAQQLLRGIRTGTARDLRLELTSLRGKIQRLRTEIEEYA